MLVKTFGSAVYGVEDNDRILLEAKRLLVHTNLSIKEIGQELGFEDPAYFVRYFKKNSETTPVEFRENCPKK